MASEELDNQESYTVQKADDFTERFIVRETVAATGEYFLIDFQASDAKITLDEEGNEVEFGGPFESSVRIVLPPSIAEELMTDLISAVDSELDIETEELLGESTETEINGEDAQLDGDDNG